MITFSCPSCNRSFQVKDQDAGKTGSCPGCKAAITVPAIFEEPPPDLRPVAAASVAPLQPAQAPAAPAGPSTTVLVLAGSGVAAALIIGICLMLALSRGHASAPQAQVAAAEPAPPAAPPPTPAPVPEIQPAIAPAYQNPGPQPTTAQAQAAALQAQISDLREQQQVEYLRKEKERIEHQLNGTSEAVAVPPTATQATSRPQPGTISDVVAMISPSVVTVRTDVGIGAGWFAFESDLVVTNHHVIRDGHSFTVRMFTGDRSARRSRDYTCTVLAIDLAHDLALLKLDTKLSAIPLGLATLPVRAGDPVIAIGNPAVGDTILDQSVSTGIISNVERHIEGKPYLQTTAAINPGNSGGPLVNNNGEVVGVVTAKGVDVENIGFAVPVTFVKKLYEGRDTTFAVKTALPEWEKQHMLEALGDSPGAIPVNSLVNDMLLMDRGRTLVALATDRNKVLIIDLASSKVTSEIFPGTEPTQILPGSRANEIWVLNATSKSFALVNLKLGKVVTTVHVTHEPVTFTLVKDRIWFVDDRGKLVKVETTGDGERAIEIVDVRSVVFNPESPRGDLLCGTAHAWLCSITADKVLGIQDKLVRLEEKKDEEQRQMASDPNLYKEYNATVSEEQDLSKQLPQCTKSLNAPPQGQGSGYEYQIYMQALFLDAAHKRLYFNRCAVDSGNPENMIGVFQDATHSLIGNPLVADFVRKFPYFNQILAVSPDGRFAASGSHLFNAQDFTVITELPMPTTAVAFSADSKTIYLADPFNGQIDVFPIPKLGPDGKPLPPEANSPAPDDRPGSTPGTAADSPAGAGESGKPARAPAPAAGGSQDP